MSKETVTIEIKGVSVDTDNDAMTVQEFVPMFTRATSAVRKSKVEYKGRYLTPTNKFLLAVPDLTIVTRGKRTIEAFITLYVVVDMDDRCSQRAAHWGGDVDVKKNIRSRIIGDILWDSATRQHYVRSTSGCSKLQEWLS